MSGNPRSLPVKVNEMPRTDPVTESTKTNPGLLQRLRSNPTSHLALKIGVGILGTLVVAIGIVAIPLPGPGWAIVIVGLAILAVEFPWARRLLTFTKRHVQAWTHWVMRQPLALRALIATVGFIFISTVVWLSVKLTMKIDLAVLIWNYLFQK